jgi:1-deoxy-D-xylulose-5-phosphate synthase
MLRWSVARGRPGAIRYPKATCPHEIGAFSAPIREGRGVFVRESCANLLVAFTGGLYPQVAEAADLLLSEGIAADLYNVRFLKPVDEDYLACVLARYPMAVVVEEGTLSGGSANTSPASASGITSNPGCSASGRRTASFPRRPAPNCFPSQASTPGASPRG